MVMASCGFRPSYYISARIYQGIRAKSICVDQREITSIAKQTIVGGCTDLASCDWLLQLHFHLRGVEYIASHRRLSGAPGPEWKI